MDSPGGNDPIGADDRIIAAALADAHVPSLMMAIAHLAGDVSHLRPEWQPKYRFGGDGQGELSPQAQAEIRAIAHDAVRAWRNRGCPMPAPPAGETIRRMMDFLAGTAIPEHYVPFLREELGLDAANPRPKVWHIDVAHEIKKRFRVLIVGAGMSGMLAAIELEAAGISFLIVEKNGDVGGTWFENSYPGCRVDNQNHLYSYSFEPNHDWPYHFSTRDVLYDYFRRIADKYGLRRHIRFNSSVESAAFDARTGRWSVTVRQGEREETIEANAVISAVGQLNRPRYPDIAGRERFEGPAFHSARWDHTRELAGKRVAVIGTGASAFQFVPAIAPKTRELFIFQRTPPWLMPAANYHHAVPDGKKWLLKNIPLYAKWYRFWLFWMLTDGLYHSVKADPAWNGSAGAISQANDELRQKVIDYIAAQVGDDPELLAKVIPAYPPGGKRAMRDNGVWIDALKRDNVHLLTDPIREISRAGIVTQSGREIAVDVIIYGTGFQASRFLWPMQIKGRGGIDLQENWAGDPRAYLGVTIPGFPNLFCLYGPNTNIVVNGSIIFFSECGVHYIMSAIKHLLETGQRTIECRRDVHDAFNAKVDAANAQMAWGVGQVSSWYKNARGRVTQNWPFPLVDYWTRTRALDPREFEFG